MSGPLWTLLIVVAYITACVLSMALWPRVTRRWHR